ncbi:MAG TPA: GAF domain-containing protein [Thermomicrobiales bacterium]|nr:GAF domain-containing protein [Thermomicrobiales bacterium]
MRAERATGCGIGDASRATGVSPQTIRAWQRGGRLPLRRDERGRRVFGADDLDAIRRLRAGAADDLRAYLDLDTALAAVLARALALFDTAEGGIYLADVGSTRLRLALASAASAGNIGKTLLIGEGVAGRAAALPGDRPEPLVVDDYAGFVAGDAAPSARVRTVVAVPLCYDGALVGVLDIVNAPTAALTPERVARLRPLADEAALALHNARRYTALRRQASALAALARAGALLGQQRVTAAVVAVGLAELAQTFAYPLAGLYLRDGGALRWRAGCRPAAGDAPPALVARAFQSGQTAVSPPTAAACDWHGARIAVPLRHGGDALGVLAVATHDEPLTADDRRLLELYAAQLAGALANARRHEERAAVEADLAARVAARTVDLERLVARLQVAAEVARELTEVLDADDLVTLIPERIAARLGYAQVDLLVRDEGSGDLLLYGPRPAPGTPLPILARQRPDEGICGWVATHGEPLNCPDVRADPRFLPDARVGEARAELAVPVRSRGTLLGVLGALSERADAFDDSDLLVLQTLADQLAVALGNARLYADLDRQRREEAAFGAIAADLASSLDRETLLRRIAGHARGLFAGDCVQIFLADGEAGLLRCAALAGDNGDRPVGLTVAPDEGAAGYAWQRGLPLNVEDYWADDRLAHRPFIDGIARGAGVTSVLTAPIALRDERLGVLQVAARARRRFTPRDEALLARLATQAALAVRNARLYADAVEARALAEQRSDTLAALLETSRAIAGHLDLAPLLDDVVDRVVDLIPADAAMLYLLEGRSLRPVVARGDHARAADWSSFTIDEGFTGWAARHARPVWTGDALNDERNYVPPGAARRQRSLLAVPLIADGAVLGVLTLGAFAADHFRPADVDLLVAFADQAAVAVKSARLAERTRALYLAGVKSLAAMVDARDPDALGHSERVAAYARATAGALGLPPEEVEAVELAGLMHDIGKIGIPDAILQKPGRLDPAELAVMTRHAAAGADILAANAALAHLAPYVRHHHERWDGEGYPDGLAGAAIPLGAAIVAVADAFDTMTSDRPYRRAPGLAAAREELARLAGAQFHPDVVAAFLRALDGGALALVPAPRPAGAGDGAAPLAGQITPAETRALAIVYRVAAEIGRLTDLDRFLDGVLDTLIAEVAYDNCTILLLDETTGELMIQAGRGNVSGAIGRALPRDRGLSWWVLEHGVPLNVPDTRREPRFFSYSEGWRSNLIVPLVSEGRAFGVFSAQSRRVAAFTRGDEQLLGTVAGQLAQAIETARLHDTLKRLATTDGLTGVANHRHFYDRLEQELTRAERARGPLGLLLLDVDSLKSVNDTRGHLAGDALLRAVAGALTASTRRGDVVARYGGDEFAVILPDAIEADVAGCVERLLAAIGALRVEHAGGDIAPTVSVGVAHYPADGTRAKALMLAADQRLYAGRRARRARVAG